MDNDQLITLISWFTFLTYFYWIFGLSLYSLKFFSSSFNQFTSYGKLLPKKYQQHAAMVYHSIAWPAFYIFGSFWNSSVILFEFYVSYKLDLPLHRALPLSLLIEFQVVRRAIECLFVHQYSPNKMTLFQFIAGLSYYGAASFSVMELLHPSSDDIFYPVKPQHIIAVNIFVVGSIIQAATHLHFAKLRTCIGAKVYLMPVGGLFDFISCPHYFAEILIYGSLIIFTSGRNYCIWLTFIFVSVNIIHSALRTHAWYKKKFPDSYPPSRKAIFPFLL